MQEPVDHIEIDIPEELEQLILFCLDEACKTMTNGEPVIPFTALIDGDDLTIENYPLDAEEAIAAAHETVRNAVDIDGFAICYDGVVEVEEGMQDVIIAEGALAAGEEGFALGILYDIDGDGTLTFGEEPVFLGFGDPLETGCVDPDCE